MEKQKCFTIIGTGTAARRVVQYLKPLCAGLKDRLRFEEEIRSIVVDTNASVKKFAQEQTMESLLLGPGLLKGEGTNGDPEKAKAAFTESKQDFCDLILKGPEGNKDYEVRGAFVIAFAATGGTSPGTVENIYDTLSKELDITTLTTVFMPSLLGKEGGTTQRKIANDLRRRMMKNQKVQFIDRDVIYAEQVAGTRKTDTDEEDALYEVLAQNMFKVLTCWLISEYVDPSVLRHQVLGGGGGCVKMATKEFDFGDVANAAQTIGSALQSIWNDKTHQYYGKTTTVVVYREGNGWAPKFVQELNTGIHEYVERNWKDEEPEFAIKHEPFQSERAPMYGKGRLTILLSSSVKSDDEIPELLCVAYPKRTTAARQTFETDSSKAVSNFKHMLEHVRDSKDSSPYWTMFTNGDPWQLKHDGKIDFSLDPVKLGYAVHNSSEYLAEVKSVFAKDGFDFSEAWLDEMLFAWASYLVKVCQALPRMRNRFYPIPLDKTTQDLQLMEWFVGMVQKDKGKKGGPYVDIFRSVSAVEVLGMERAQLLLTAEDKRWWPLRWLNPQPLALPPETEMFLQRVGSERQQAREPKPESAPPVTVALPKHVPAAEQPPALPAPSSAQPLQATPAQVFTQPSNGHANIDLAAASPATGQPN